MSGPHAHGRTVATFPAVSARPVPERRRSDIVDAAARLFAEHGYDAVGIDDIGAAVGISGPSVYWHFPNKQAIAGAVAVMAAERFADALEAADARSETALSYEDVVRTQIATAMALPHHTIAGLSTIEQQPPDDRERVRAAVTRSGQISHRALAQLNPALSPQMAQARIVSQLGALVTVARDRYGVTRKKAEDLIVASSTALGAAPPPTNPRRSGAPVEPRRWNPAPTRREAIVGVARDLFRTQGYQNVGIGDIAAAADLSAPTLYHYFRSKGDILRAIWERPAMRFVIGALDALDGAESATDALDRLARAYVRVAHANHDLIVLVFLQLNAGVEYQGNWVDNRQVLIDAWTSVIGELRPELKEPERRLLVEATLAVALFATPPTQARQPWEDEITTCLLAFAKGLTA